MCSVHHSKSRNEKKLTLKHHATTEVEGGLGIVQIDQILRNVTAVVSIALGRVDEGFGGDGAASAHVCRSRIVGSWEEGES